MPAEREQQAAARARCSSASAARRAPAGPPTSASAIDAAGYILTGPDLLDGGRRPEGWPLDRDPLGARDERRRPLRGGRRPQRLGQARRRRGRRRRDGASRSPTAGSKSSQPPTETYEPLLRPPSSLASSSTVLSAVGSASSRSSGIRAPLTTESP